MATPRENEIYKHFKGKQYRVLHLAKHSETGEEMVVYQALYGEGDIYVRPLPMFTEVLDKEKYPEAEQERRFERVEQDNTQEEQPDLDPLLIEFLDTDSYEEKLNILTALHQRITDDMISTLAVALDVDVPAGEMEERYAALKNCLIMLEKYECSRLR